MYTYMHVEEESYKWKLQYRFLIPLISSTFPYSTYTLYIHIHDYHYASCKNLSIYRAIYTICKQTFHKLLRPSITLKAQIIQPQPRSIHSSFHRNELTFNITIHPPVPTFSGLLIIPSLTCAISRWIFFILTFPSFLNSLGTKLRGAAVESQKGAHVCRWRR